MEDFYKILGVPPTASEAEIKSHYKKLVMKHHPDRGGDPEVIKKINAAYDVLGDAQKRAQYDRTRRTTPFDPSNVNFSDIFSDIFMRTHTEEMHSQFKQAFGGSFEEMFGYRPTKNRDINIQYSIPLADSFTGKRVDINFTLQNGVPQTVSIDIPAGITHSGTIRYNNMGGNENPNIPRGNLNVIIIVLPDPNFTRVHDDLYTKITINPIEAIIGCEKTVTHITGASHVIKIRPGISAGTEYAVPGQGFKNLQTGQRGRFVGIVEISPLNITDPQIITQLTELNARITA
jgi:DnaJ-class molecular chaperone